MEEFKREYIEYLVHQWKNGLLTEKEQADFDHWHKVDRQESIEIPQDFAKNEIHLRDRMHKEIKARIKHSKPRNRNVIIRSIWELAIAAAILLSCVLVGYYFFRHKEEKDTTIAQNNNYIAPGSNKAMLTLASGKQVPLSNSGLQAITLQGYSNVTAHNGKLIYNSAHDEESGQAIFNSIATPKGGQYEVILPDGTHVWLNAASLLRFPVSFKGKERKVHLMGEAYFEVAHNKAMPFIVQTHDQSLQVLGTHFNVNAYAEEHATTTTLSQGSVRITSTYGAGLLKPGQQSLLKGGRMLVAQVDTSIAMAWKEGSFAFARTDIRDVLRQVSRWYDLEVIYQGSVPDFTLSGKISRNEDLSAVLRMLTLNGVHYKLERRILTITPY